MKQIIEIDIPKKEGCFEESVLKTIADFEKKLILSEISYYKKTDLGLGK